MHFELPSFRVKGKILATLHLHTHRAMVKLTPEQQQQFMDRDAKAFFPVQGSWGQKGATFVQLEIVKQRDAVEAAKTAWRNMAPRKMQSLLP